VVLVKAPLCKGMLSNVASDKGLRDCFDMKFYFLQSLRLAVARHLPLHKGGFVSCASNTRTKIRKVGYSSIRSASHQSRYLLEGE